VSLNGRVNINSVLCLRSMPLSRKMHSN